jgi:uncharacterized protein YigA (DUF484 family)
MSKPDYIGIQIQHPQSASIPTLVDWARMNAETNRQIAEWTQELFDADRKADDESRKMEEELERRSSL